MVVKFNLALRFNLALGIDFQQNQKRARINLVKL